MHIDNLNKENEILKLAIEAFRKNVPLQFNVEPLLKEPRYNFDFRPDMELDLQINGQAVRYCAEIKKILTKANMMLLLMHKQKFPYPLLLVANYINPVMAEELKKEKIEFIDTAGNAFINQPPIYIFIKGNKLPEIQGQTQNRAFRQTGLKIIYAFLCNPRLENAPFREIAKKTKVALGTVGQIKDNLKELGFLMDTGQKTYKLLQKDKLLQRWITAYAEQLRPKLILGRYKAGYFDWWQNQQLDVLKAKWGGEVAAAKLTKYLHPEIITIYTKKEYLTQLLLECKLKKDPTGEIEILDQFWNCNEYEEDRDMAGHHADIKYRDLVNPILIYADLIATGNQRNIETAKMIYEEYIIRLIREN